MCERVVASLWPLESLGGVADALKVSRRCAWEVSRRSLGGVKEVSRERHPAMAEIVPDARELLPEDSHQRRAQHVRAARVAAEREVPEEKQAFRLKRREGATRRSRARGTSRKARACSARRAS